MISEIDSITTCPLPTVKDRTTDYPKYIGIYTNNAGRKLEISLDNNILY